MKKVLLTSVLVAIITVTLVVVGVIIVDYCLNRIYDVKVVSIDGEANISFNDVTHEKQDNYYEFYYFCEFIFFPIEENSFYEKHIVSNPNYLYTAEENNNLREEDNEKTYVFMNNNHYFFIRQEDMGVVIYDGMRSWENDGFTFAVHMPCVEDFFDKVEVFVPWEASVGLSSYEDLLNYYSRLSDTVYEIDDQNKTLYLSIYNESLGWMDSGVKLEASEMGFKIKIMPNYLNMGMEWNW